MQVTFKNLVAAAAFFIAGAASAATVTVTAGSTVYKGHTVSGAEALTLSTEAVEMLNAIRSAVQSAGTELVVTQDAEGQLLSVRSTAPVGSLKVEDTSDQIQNIVSNNGLTLVTSP